MKKNGLLKSIAICFIVAVVLSWFIPTGIFNGTTFQAGETLPVGIINLFRVPVLTFQTFIQYTIFLVTLGLFYGVVNKTESYSGIVEGIAKRWKGKEKAFLIIVTIIFALLSAVSGNLILLFALAPFIGAVLLKMNFNNVTALLGTVGAILVGETASIIGFNGYGYIVNIFHVTMKDEIITRIILFAILTGLYVFYINIKTKKEVTSVKEVKEEKKTKGRKTTKEEVVEQPKKVEIPFYEDKKGTKSKWPLIIVSVLLFIICLISMYNWYYAFGIETFNNLFNTIDGVKMGDYPLMHNILNGLSSFGFWSTYELSVALFIGSIIIAWIYNIKVSDYIEAAKKGMKEMLPIAFIATLANIVFTVMILNQTDYLTTIINFINKGKTAFNLPLLTLSSIIGSLCYNDLYYYIADLSGVALNYEAVYYPIAGIVMNAIHGIVMMILPTSLFLVAGLKLFNVSLKEWAKTIWAYLVEAFVVVMIISIVVIIML